MKRLNDLSQLATREAADDVDARRLRYVFNLSTIVGGLVLILFAFRQLGSDNYLLQYFLFGAAAGVWLTFAYVRITQQVAIGVKIASVLVAILSIALVYTGGQENTGLYWTFPLLYIQFIYLGAVRGLAMSLLVAVIIGVMLGNTNAIPADYSRSEISRAMAALVTLIILAAISEFYRQRSQLDLSNHHTGQVVEAVTDPLTGLTNRRFLESFFYPECRRQEDSHFPLAVIACDIDNFKRINDDHGHQRGDEVLVQVSESLRSSLRSSDVISRVGGEEFLILAQRAKRTSAIEIAEKLRQRIEKLEIDELPDGITASFGVVVADHYSELKAALLNADANLYRAKNEGRNRVVAEGADA